MKVGDKVKIISLPDFIDDKSIIGKVGTYHRYDPDPYTHYPILINIDDVIYGFANCNLRVISETSTPSYYDNTKGSLYKVATERKWNTYIFDVVKRLERGGKKDPLRQEIEKSIAVLQIWLNEIE